jgi:hypothetical protein
MSKQSREQSVAAAAETLEHLQEQRQRHRERGVELEQVRRRHVGVPDRRN